MQKTKIEKKEFENRRKRRHPLTRKMRRQNRKLWRNLKSKTKRQVKVQVYTVYIYREPLRPRVLGDLAW